MKITRLRGPIPEKQIDPLIARDSELIWNNISGKPTLYPPINHGHSDNEGFAEPWLQNLLNSLIPNKVSVQGLYFNLGLAANIWTRIWSQNNLDRRKVYLAKIMLECGSVPPYSGCAVFTIGTTNCNGTNAIYVSQMMMHNGNSINVELRAIEGAQSSPAIDLRFPTQALPTRTTITCEFLNLF